MNRKNSIIIIIATLIIAMIAIGTTASLTIFSAEARHAGAVDKAAKYLDEGNYSEAVLQFTKAIEIDDKRADVWVAKVNAQKQLNDTTGAVDTLMDFVSRPIEYYENVDSDAVNDIVAACIDNRWIDADQIDQLERIMKDNNWITETSDIQISQDTFLISKSIGEVNGRIYATRFSQNYPMGEYGLVEEHNIPTCELLPVNTGKYEMLASFCYYKGYIYYISSEEGTSDFSTGLYRCKPDGTEQTMILDMVAEISGGIYSEGARFFTILDDKLYLDRYYGYDVGNCYIVDLETLNVSRGTMPTQEFTDVGGDSFVQATYDGYKIYNDNGQIYKFDGENRELLVSTLYDQVIYGSRKSTNVTIDGAANGYVYYSYISESHRSEMYPDSHQAVLYRVSIDGGEPEFVDERMPAGGGGPYFCW